MKPNKNWRSMRANHLLTFPECRACGSEEGVVVHHLRYRGKRGVSEKPGDLVTMCRDCHDEFHRSLGRSGTSVEATIAFCRERAAAVDAYLSSL